MEYRQLGPLGSARLGAPRLGNDDLSAAGGDFAKNRLEPNVLAGARRQLDLAARTRASISVDSSDIYSFWPLRGDHRRTFTAGRAARTRVVLATKARFPIGEGPNDAGAFRAII